MKKFSFSDLALLVGFLGMSYGFWLAWRPLGFILGGLSLVAFSILTERGSTASRRRS
jgi:hypothetical protein